MRRSLIISILLIIILGAGLIAGLILIKQPQDIRKQAAVKETVTVDDFKTPYSTMLARYKNQPKRIQLFGGGLVLAEFSDPDKNIYAGHLGNFWAPPFFSAQSLNVQPPGILDDWRKAFNHGLVIYNIGYGGGTPEKPTDPATETADWYPSKIVMTHFYPGGGGGTDVKGVKVALPATRGIGLRMTFTNKTPSDQLYNVLFLGSLPTFGKLIDWAAEDAGWNWWLGISSPTSTTSSYDKDNQIIIIKDDNQAAYLAAGLSDNLDSWGTDNDPYPMYVKFLNQLGGKLDNSNADTAANGSAFGLVAKLPTLSPNQSHTVTLIVGIGSTEAEAKDIVLNYRSKNIETEADNYWNKKLTTAFNNLPDLQTGNDTLDKIYKNAVLTYLVNRWDIFNSVGEAAGFGQSTSLFPWFTGTQQILAMSDPTFWKTQLTRLLSLDLNKCRAYNPVNKKHLCDTTYSSSPYALVQAVYEYSTLTGDFAFFKDHYDYLRGLIIADDNKADSDGLVNFGNDRNLYEFNIHCNLGGEYTGKVITPNADRIVAHRQLAEIAQKLGKPDSDMTYHQNKANQVKTAIQSLWNPSKSNFSSISYYNADGTPRPSPVRSEFKTVLPNLLLQYDDVLTPAQITALTSDLVASFGGNYGITSLPVGSTWCSREDWHGPGLYSGAVGAIIAGLFRQGYQNQAYNYLTAAGAADYSYLSTVPYFSQAFPWDQPQSALAVGYLEGVSMAQAIIRGMFGVETNTDHTKIAPHIPTGLLNSGPASLIGLKTQGHLWDITVNSTSAHSLIYKVNQISSPGTKTDHFRLGYAMNGTLNLTVHNLTPGKSFSITGTPIAQGTPFTVYATTNDNGVLTKSIALNGDFVIKGVLGNPPASSTPTPPPTSPPTSAPTSPPTSPPCSCTGNLLPSSASSDVGDTTAFSMRISNITSGCSVRRVNFASSNTSVATVSPTSDSAPPYTTTATALRSGSTRISGRVIMSDGGVGCSDFSSLSVSAPPTPTPTASPCAVPSAPNSLSPIGPQACATGATKAITFDWNSVANATNYRLRIDDTDDPWNCNNPNDHCIDGLTTTDYTMTLTPDEYQWWVIGVNNSGTCSEVGPDSTHRIFSFSACIVHSPTPTPTARNTPTPTNTPPQPSLTATATPVPCNIPGDANFDCRVDGLDYAIWLINFENSITEGKSVGDFNNDGTVDGLDYAIWWLNFGKSG